MMEEEDNTQTIKEDSEEHNMAEGPVTIKQEPKEEEGEEKDMELNIQMAMSTAIQAQMGLGGRDGRMRYRYRSLVTPDTPICEVCQSEFSSHKVLSLHKLCHFNTGHVCYVCDGYFIQPDTLAMHMATTHRHLNNYADERDSLTCPICLQRFSGKNSFIQHQTQHALKDSLVFMCRICGLDFNNSRSLIDHLTSTQHAEMKVRLQGLFVCVDCRGVFATRDAYAMHMMLRAQTESCSGLLLEEKESKVMSSMDDLLSPVTKQEVMDDIVYVNENEHDEALNLTKKMRHCNKTGAMLPHELAPPTPPSFTSPTVGQVNSCTKCYSSFASQDALAMHIMLHTRADSMPEMSQMTPPVPGSLRSNSAPVVTNNGTVPLPTQAQWRCERCTMTFDSCDSLAMHMMAHAHQSRAIESLPPGLHQLIKSNKQLPILNSSYGYNGPRTLESPSSSKSEGEVLPAQAEYNLSKRSASVDVGGISKRGKFSDNVGKTWECWECKELFPSQTLWLEHIFNCSRLRLVTHQCRVCSAEFPDLITMQEHLVSSGHGQHVSEKEHHICSACGWVGNDLASLDEHRGACVMCKTPETSHESPTQSVHPENTTISSKHMNSEQADRSRPKSDTHDRDANEMIRNSRQSDDSVQMPASSTNQDNGLKQLERPMSTPAPGAISQSGIAASDEGGEGEIIDFVLGHSSELSMCKHCNIVYLDKTMYYLHMGLHNLNDPWQCNMCGKQCSDKHEFTSHVIHYQ